MERESGIRPGIRRAARRWVPPPARSKTNRPLALDLADQCRVLGVPHLAAAVPRLAERARTEGWSYEEFLAACLEREVAARHSDGKEARIRDARFPAYEDPAAPPFDDNPLAPAGVSDAGFTGP